MPPPEPSANTDWFAGHLDKITVEKMIAAADDGDFLVRCDGPEYAVCVNDNGRCSSYKIKVSNNTFIFANKPFHSLQEIIQVMTHNPIQRANGQPLTLKKAASAKFRGGGDGGGGGGGGGGPNRNIVPTAAQRAALAAQAAGGGGFPSGVVSPSRGQPAGASVPTASTRMKMMQQQQHENARGGGGSPARARRAAPSMEARQALMLQAKGGQLSAAPGAGGVGGAGGAGRGHAGVGGPGLPPRSRSPQPGRVMSPARGGGGGPHLSAAPMSPSSAVGPPTPSRNPTTTPITTTGKLSEVLVKKVPGLGFGLTLNDMSPFGIMVSAVKAELLKAVVHPGMKIQSVDGTDCSTKNVDFVKKLLAGKDSATLVFLPDPRASDISVADGEIALYIAPIDISGFDKLDVKAIDKFNVTEECRGKLFNRYIDILPGPATRVKLNQIAMVPTSDYINANYVRGYNNEKKEYIAAQGPLPTTLDAFVRMVWEQQCQIIVQCTGFKENGKRKCERYYPVITGEPGAQHYDDIKMVLLETKRFPGYQVSTLVLSRRNKPPLKVLHYWFIAWPDHGVPQNSSGQLYTTEVLAMMKDVREQRDIISVEAGLGREPPPMLVHCSAGVGRTGTIIVIDHVMNAINKGNKVDLNHIINEIRDDRMALVQHTVQYKFAYQAVIDYAEEKLKGHTGDIYELPPAALVKPAKPDATGGGVYSVVNKSGKNLRKLSRGSFSLKVEKTDRAVYAPGFAGTKETLEEEEEEEAKDNIEDEPWYYGPLPRSQMKATLADAPVGAFGVRSSESQKGCFVLTLQQKSSSEPDGKRMLSILIKPHPSGDDTKFRLDQCSDKLFDSVPTLVRYFREHNVMYVDDRTGDQHLLYLLPNTD